MYWIIFHWLQHCKRLHFFIFFLLHSVVLTAQKKQTNFLFSLSSSHFLFKLIKYFLCISCGCIFTVVNQGSIFKFAVLWNQHKIYWSLGRGGGDDWPFVEFSSGLEFFFNFSSFSDFFLKISSLLEPAVYWYIFWTCDD